MLTYYKCKFKRENNRGLVSLEVYTQQDCQQDWDLLHKRYYVGFDREQGMTERAKELSEKQRKIQNIADFAWQTVIDTREVTQ